MLYPRSDRTVRLLGQGTFGKVVEAVDIETERRVAIKIIRATPKYRDDSKIEIRVLQRLRERDPNNSKYAFSFTNPDSWLVCPPVRPLAFSVSVLTALSSQQMHSSTTMFRSSQSRLPRLRITGNVCIRLSKRERFPAVPNATYTRFRPTTAGQRCL